MNGLLKENLEKVKSDIQDALKKSGRGASEKITLVAASKAQSFEKIKALHDLGVTNFGENYLQELMKKKQATPLSIKWHFIGRLQSNKLKEIIKNTVLVHSVHRKKIIQKISNLSKTPTHILLQLNLAEEPTKGGLFEADIPEFLDFIQKQKKVLLKGFMLMPPQNQNSRKHFQKTKKLSETWACRIDPPHELKELSMGTSHDFQAAIEEGATMVRIGSLLMGERPQ